MTQENTKISFPSFVGRSIPRIDALEKVLGRAKYTADLHCDFPVMLHAKVLRSPYAHARIISIDVSRAVRLAGVRAVVTGKDCPSKVGGRQPGILVLDEVVWAGQGVAAVVAETSEVAAEALDLIEVKYDELPAIFDAEEAMKSESPPVAPWNVRTTGTDRSTGGYPNVINHFKLRAGDIESGFAQADVIVENRFTTSRISHSQLELASCIARAEPDGGITMWTNGQGVHQIREFISVLFNLSYAKVRVISPYQGGSFGNRLTLFIEPLATLLALKTKGTVELTYSRKEMYLASGSRAPMVIYIKTGAKRDGTITARQMKIIVDNGAANPVPHDGGAIEAHQSGRAGAASAICVYRIPNFFIDSYGVSTNTLFSSSYRGFEAPQVSWATESQMDILAKKLGIDPIELRRKNVLHRGEKNALGETITSIGVMDCLDRVARDIKLEEPRTQESGRWRRGIGVAMGGKQNAPGKRSESDVVVNSDGSIEVLISCDDAGTGANTIMAQIAAEEFRVPIEIVKVTRGDSSVTPYDYFSASSFTTHHTGNAVRLACKDAINQLLQAASQRMEVAPEDLEVEYGAVTVKGLPNSRVKISDLFERSSAFKDATGLKKGTSIRGRGVFAASPAIPWDEETGLTPKMWNWFQYNACGIEVAVNIETGEIKVLRGFIAADMGFPINPKMCEGQIEGGFCMAIGATIMEEYIYENGLIINSSYGDYRLPTFLEMPFNKDFKVAFAPDPLPDGPWGAKGLGEGTMIAVAPAVANAVYNAVGMRIKDLPLSAERVLRLIKEKEEKG